MRKGPATIGLFLKVGAQAACAPAPASIIAQPTFAPTQPPAPAQATAPSSAPTIRVAAPAPTLQAAATIVPTRTPERKVQHVKGSSQKICLVAGDTEGAKSADTESNPDAF